ncbi:MAG: hypothetical protein J5979_06765 [Lachnospiraceae bacterium]|nr:hypothetical protein [Lachnospiraceae bacterium]
MWGALAIAYVVMAAIVFISMMVLLCHAWAKSNEEERMMGMEYPESTASGLLAIAVLFLTSILMAVLWPACPVILIGVFVYEKFQERWPELCGVKEEEDEPGTDS